MDCVVESRSLIFIASESHYIPNLKKTEIRQKPIPAVSKKSDTVEPDIQSVINDWIDWFNEPGGYLILSNARGNTLEVEMTESSIHQNYNKIQSFLDAKEMRYAQNWGIAHWKLGVVLPGILFAIGLLLLIRIGFLISLVVKSSSNGDGGGRSCSGVPSVASVGRVGRIENGGRGSSEATFLTYFKKRCIQLIQGYVALVVACFVGGYFNGDFSRYLLWALSIPYAYFCRLCAIELPFRMTDPVLETLWMWVGISLVNGVVILVVAFGITLVFYKMPDKDHI